MKKQKPMVLHIFKTDGTEEHRNIDHEPTAEEYQAIVGGYFECHTVTYEGKQRVMFMDEEGRLKDKPVNPMATVITGWPVVGDVVIPENCKL